MKITRHNYESFLIDYLDGTLDEATVQELLQFLSKNPDIKSEFEDMEDVTLIPGKMKMPGKQELKKADEVIPEFDLKCIAFLENDMSGSEKEAFIDEISDNPEKTKIFKQYSSARLNQGSSLSFPEKNSLKKSEIDATVFDERCIAFLENDMSAGEKEIFLKELDNDAEKSKTLNSYSLTKLSPDLSVVFPDKNSLYKRKILFTRSLVYTSLSAAAGILLIAGFFFLNRAPENSDALVLAQTELSFEDISVKYIIKTSVKENNIQNEQSPVKQNIKKNAKNPDHQPEFVASQLPDEILKNDNENVKKVNHENKEDKDTTRTLIIPNEILLKQNDKMLANNSTPKAQSQTKQGFLYYVEQGVSGFRSLTGKNVSLNHKTDEKGKTKQFAFNIGKFSVSHTKGN